MTEGEHLSSITDTVSNARRNIVWGLFNKIISILLPFILRTVMIYYLGSQYLGLNGLFTSILQVLSLAELGFGEAMTFSMYEPIAKNNKKEICALLKLYKKIYRGIGIVILIVGLIILPYLKYLIEGDIPVGINIYYIYIIYLMNTVCSYFLFAYKSSLLIANQRSDIKSNISTICSIVMYIIQITMLIFTENYYCYIIFIPILTIIDNIITEFITRRFYPQYFCEGKIDKEEMNNILKRVSGLFLYKICGIFRNSFDSIIISAFIGLIALSQYQNYCYIINSIIGILSVVTSSITASVGNNIIKKTTYENYKDYNKILMLFMWIAGWCTVSLYCMYQPFMKIWVGEELMLSNSSMTLFCIYFFTLKIGDICYVYRQAAGLWWQDKFRPVIEALVNLSLNIFLVKKFGIIGVLLSTIISLIFINFVWGAHVLFKHYFKVNPKEYFIKIIYYSIITTLNCYVTSNICNSMYYSGYIDLLYRLIICTIIPNIIFIVFYYKLSNFKESIFLLRKIVKI